MYGNGGIEEINYVESDVASSKKKKNEGISIRRMKHRILSRKGKKGKGKEPNYQPLSRERNGI